MNNYSKYIVEITPRYKIIYIYYLNYNLKTKFLLIDKNCHGFGSVYIRYFG
jgi:hypothetical protein